MPQTVSSHAYAPILGANPPWAWLVALGLVLAIVSGALVARRVIHRRLAAKAADPGADTRPTWRRLVYRLAASLRLWLVGVAALSVGTQVLVLPASIDRVIQYAAVLAVGVQMLIWAPAIVDAALRELVARTSHDGKPDDAVVSSSGVLRFLGVLLLVALVVLFSLDNLGVRITPLLAGLGIGGIAVALAVQNILSDVFGSLSIVLDKPFVVGDFIVVGQQMGTVENIGVKTTRVRALSGEQLVFANSDLLSSRIQNFKRMTDRRAVFTFGVTYFTPPDQLRRIPDIVRRAVVDCPSTRFDRCHLKSFGAYSLDFECVYFVTSPDFNLYMDIQQGVNLRLLERFEAEGVEFAFPTSVEIRMPRARGAGGGHGASPIPPGRTGPARAEADERSVAGDDSAG